MKNLNLIQRFSLISLIAIVIFAVAFGKILGNAMEQNMLNRAIKESSDIVYHNAIKHFEKDELLEPKLGDDYDDFFEEIEHLSLGPDIESVEIWNRNMIVVWSNDRDHVGKSFPQNENLQEAFNGRLISEIETRKSVNQILDHNNHTHNSEHSGDVKRLLELYVPLKFGKPGESEVSVVFEIYQNISPLYANIGHHKRLIWYWTCIGFSGLYLILFGIIWNASRRIDKQTKLIKQSKQDWEETFNSITDMITVHDNDFNIIQSNRAADEILGISSLNDSMKCYEHYHGTETAPEGCAGAQCLQMGKPATVEMFEPHINKFIEIRSIPRINETNNIEGLIHVVRDISKRKNDEELIQTQINRLSALRSIDRAIIGSMDMNITLDIFLEQVTKHLDIDAASILLLNKHTQTLEYIISKGFRSSALKYTKLRLGESNAGCAAIERRIVTIENLMTDIDGFSSSKQFIHENFLSYYAVPLIAKGEVKGVLELFHRSRKEAASDWLGFLEAIADQGAIAIDNATLFDELQRSNADLILAYDTTIEGWSRALDLRDKETEGHTQRVTDMTIHIARNLGVKEINIAHFRRGALLHDIGKMGVPDSILLKPGPLTDEEREIMRRHPVYAYQMLYPIEYLRSAIDIPYYHHEKWDGTGYPVGLKGEAIPVAARIFAIVDVWDALRSDRPYRAAWSKEKVIEHIRSLSGSHFDPDIVKAFLKTADEMEETVISYS
jgi:putative nucleotidyltransferase with HDIG domain/PAS domain S-box-containing protein